MINFTLVITVYSIVRVPYRTGVVLFYAGTPEQQTPAQRRDDTLMSVCSWAAQPGVSPSLLGPGVQRGTK